MPADTSDWDAYIQQLEDARQTPYRLFRVAAKELAARMLALVIPRTPVGVYAKDTGKQGGTLRRGWVSKTHHQAESNADQDGPSAAEMRAWAQSLPVRHTGNTYEITVSNPVEYASYVEYGHRQEPGRFVPAIGKRLKKSWVEGQHMMTFSEEKIRSIQPQVLERVLAQWLKEEFENGK